MTKQEILDRLVALKGAPEEWQYDPNAGTHTVVVDDLTLEVKRIGDTTYYEVRHARYGTLLERTPQMTAAWAKRDALEFAHSYVLGHHEPTHAE